MSWCHSENLSGRSISLVHLVENLSGISISFVHLVENLSGTGQGVKSQPPPVKISETIAAVSPGTVFLDHIRYKTQCFLN